MRYKDELWLMEMANAPDDPSELVEIAELEGASDPYCDDDVSLWEILDRPEALTKAWKHAAARVN